MTLDSLPRIRENTGEVGISQGRAQLLQHQGSHDLADWLLEERPQVETAFPVAKREALCLSDPQFPHLENGDDSSYFQDHLKN